MTRGGGRPCGLPAQGDGGARTASRYALGLRAAYAEFSVAVHHHNFEFAADADGTLPFDRLVAGTDPDLVSFELDVYWLTRGGQDALAMIRRLACLLYTTDAADEEDVENSRGRHDVHKI